MVDSSDAARIKARLQGAQWQGYARYLTAQALRYGTRPSVAEISTAYDRGLRGILPDDAALALAKQAGFESGRESVLDVVRQLRKGLVLQGSCACNEVFAALDALLEVCAATSTTTE